MTVKSITFLTWMMAHPIIAQPITGHPVYLASGVQPAIAAAGELDGSGVASVVVAGPGKIRILGHAEILPGPAEPTALLIYDFNGDGRKDLVIATARGGVVVLLNRGNGEFSAPRSFAAGLHPSGLAVADFNGDGLPDLAVANRYGNDISILPGKGDGTFGEAIAVATGAGPAAIVTADFNHDGIPDLATADFVSNTITVLLGSGGGRFQRGGVIKTGNGPVQLVSADFNEDGAPDLAVLCELDGSVRVMFNDGAGAFAAGSVFRGVQRMAAADLNGDGHIDLALQSADTALLQVLLGKGDGAFTAGFVSETGTAVLSLVTGDFNGAGRPDVALAETSGTVTMLSGAGMLSTQSPSTASGIGPVPAPISTTTTLSSSANPATLGHAITLTATVSQSAATGMVTFYDGVDILGIRSLASGVASLTTILLPFGNRQLKAYYAGDSIYRASTSLPLAQAVKALLETGLGPEATYQVMSHPQFAVMGDFNGDGKPDIAITSELQGLSVQLGRGDGKFFPISSLGAYDSTAIAVGDFNGDGKSDLVIANCGFNFVTVLLGNGDGSFQGGVDYPTGNNPCSVVVADFNGDGKADIATANLAGTISILLGRGDGSFPAAVNHGAGTQPLELKVADFNGDGKADLAFLVVDQVRVQIGNGDGTFQPAVPYSTGDTPQLLVVGDFDGDGHPDLVVYDHGPGWVSVLLGQGNGAFTAAGTVDLKSLGVVPGAMAVGDFVGEGKADLVFADGNNGLSMLTGKGDGTFRAMVHYQLPGSNPFALVVGDFNRDGASDAAVVDFDAGTMEVLLGLQPVTAVTFTTNPAGLFLSVDGAPSRLTPFTLQLTRTAHTVSVLGVEFSVCCRETFTQWLDNSQPSPDGPTSHSISVTSTPATYTAVFSTEYFLLLEMQPAAGGGTVTQSGDGYYAPGKVVNLTATPAAGYTFGGWLGGVANPSSPSTTFLQPNFEAGATAIFLSKTNITFQTSPPGLLVSVDGALAVYAPFTLTLAQGPHTVSTVSQSVGSGTLYNFHSWSDSGTPAHAFTVGASTATLTASFDTLYLLVRGVFPAGGGSLTVLPPSADGYYLSGTQLNVSVVPSPLYTFSGFSGALTGTANPQTLTLTAPASVVANFIPPNPLLTGSVHDVARQGSVVTLSLVLTDGGQGDAQNTMLTSLTAGVLTGTGSVSLTGPSLPYRAGAVAAGGTAGIPVQLTITGTVSRVRLTFAGTMQNTIGTNLAFGGAGQVIIP